METRKRIIQLDECAISLGLRVLARKSSQHHPLQEFYNDDSLQFVDLIGYWDQKCSNVVSEWSPG